MSIEVPVVRPRRRLARHVYGALLVAGLSLFGLHEAFHFADWLSWGLGVDALPWARKALWPFFGAHDLFGDVSHAIVNLVVLAALGAALWREFRRSLPDIPANGCSRKEYWLQD